MSDTGDLATATVVAPAPSEGTRKRNVSVRYEQYRDERDLPTVMNLIDNELSEPYSIFTYRYFLHNWPQLAFLAYDGDHCFGTVVCKMDVHREQMLRGYLAMLVVEKPYRSLGAGSALVKLAIGEMIKGDCEEVVLEAEVSNSGALALYQNLGFIRDKRLHRYYLNGVDAYRLKLLLPLTQKRQDELAAQQLAELQLSGNDSNKTDISGSSQHPSVGESADAQNAAALRRDHDLSSDNASANSCSHHHDLKLDQKS